MKISIQREALLKPLQIVSGVVERRQTLPILSNLLLSVKDGRLALTGTDLEVEMVARLDLDSDATGDITLPARKMMDICRSLPDQAVLELTVDKDKAVIRSGKSRFTLATLPAAEFPGLEVLETPVEFQVPQRDLKRLIDQTQFSMAHQDVRYYLNGLMLEMADGVLRAVATDGHRLALCEVAADVSGGGEQIILPRKGVLELARLLEDSDAAVLVQVGKTHLRVGLGEITFTSKLIDGRFPDYTRVIPSSPVIRVLCERDALRQALARASVLANEKYRGIRLQLSKDLLRATVHNPEQEEAEEELEVVYDGAEFEIGFNVSYFLDVLAALKSERVQIGLLDPNSSCLIEGMDEPQCRYVVMPMRL